MLSKEDQLVLLINVLVDNEDAPLGRRIIELTKKLNAKEKPLNQMRYSNPSKKYQKNLTRPISLRLSRDLYEKADHESSKLQMSLSEFIRASVALAMSAKTFITPSDR